MSREPEQLDLLDWLAAQEAREAVPQSDPMSALASTEEQPAPVLLTRVDPSCNMRRFYSVALAQSLWGECGVVRHWGRIGSPGQRRTDWYEAPPEAERALDSLLRAKRRRGYRACNSEPAPREQRD